ncbi:chorion peroxidase-like isoform X2 [Daphnia pulicaria]|uniref:chorion peroxidase-like isoform X2 n=1 Tax=Daphnia pulicaria TaxID=35523 RepID=UPI001EECB645|nr:chorion peroxidase-like isoform X2 [Daphnia pulicaria]
MHTLWLLEHSRIAAILYTVVPRQTNEFYFQHARRIVIAEMQHIIYNEYLPVIIVPMMAAKVALGNGYLNTGNPAIFTEIFIAAFRKGHSQLKSFIRLFERDGSFSRDSNQLISSQIRSITPPGFLDPISWIRLFGASFMYLPKKWTALLLSTSQVNLLSMLCVSTAYNLAKRSTLGLDLTALNIQRGRDQRPANIR